VRVHQQARAGRTDDLQFEPGRFGPYRGDVDLFPIPVNQIALEIGSERSANMVMLGCFLKLTKVVRLEAVLESIEHMMGGKKKLVEQSKLAVSEGYKRFPHENGKK
jgi:Pyruvate/2-oxoacid:ferredoxin oxidoreductase gamma subunit